MPGLGRMSTGPACPSLTPVMLMTLLDLCEPVFQALCRLSRLHRAGAAPPSRAVREVLAGPLAEARERASHSGTLLAQFESVEPAIVLCIDRAVRVAGWPCVSGWRAGAIAVPLAEEDTERFFAMVRQHLEDPSEDADERLEVLASCAALAFAVPGLDAAQSATLQQLRLRLACDTPTAYESAPKIITDDLTRPSPRPALAAVAIGLTALAVYAAVSSVRSNGHHPGVATGHGGGVAGVTP